MKEKIKKKLAEVIDPEIGISIVKMGMIKDVEENKGKVKIKFKPTTPFCPMIGMIVDQIKAKVKEIKEVKEVDVEVDLK